MPLSHQVSALEMEIGHLQSSVTTVEGLLTEYRAKVTTSELSSEFPSLPPLFVQLEKSHRENEELSKELRKTEQQLDRCRQECSLEIDRVSPAHSCTYNKREASAVSHQGTTTVE